MIHNFLTVFNCILLIAILGGFEHGMFGFGGFVLRLAINLLCFGILAVTSGIEK